MKTCDNCTWKKLHKKNMWCHYKDNKPDKNTCKEHNYECDNYDCNRMAEFEINGKKLCEKCAFLELGINIRTTKQYYSYDWDCYFGDDNDNEKEEIIEKACEYENIEYKYIFNKE